jgi:hypothetical protein
MPFCMAVPAAAEAAALDSSALSAGGFGTLFSGGMISLSDIMVGANVVQGQSL